MLIQNVSPHGVFRDNFQDSLTGLTYRPFSEARRRRSLVKSGPSILGEDTHPDRDGAPTMNRTTLIPLLVYCLLVPTAWGQEGDAEQERAIAKIQELGGKIERDETE